MTMGGDRGILYIVSGERCRGEAMLSARSVKAAWPDVPIVIMTDAPVDGACFDSVQLIASDDDNLTKVRHLPQTPFERTLLLDSDTCCLHPMPELFDLLDRYDLAAAHEAGRFATRWDGAGEVFISDQAVPDAFPELNSGVVAFRRQRNVLDLFERWLGLSLAGRAGSPPHTQDQPALRRAVYDSGLRVAVLPPEYNFRLDCPGFARGPIKLLHGRWRQRPIAGTPEETFATLARTFNANLGPRVFVHAFGMICGHGPFGIPYDDPARTIELGDLRTLAAEREGWAAERDLYVSERDAYATERDRWGEERDRLLRDCDRLAGDRDRLAGDRDRLAGELAHADQQKDRFHAERDEARAQLATMRASRSWRLTWPLRAMMGRLWSA